MRHLHHAKPNTEPNTASDTTANSASNTKSNTAKRNTASDVTLANSSSDFAEPNTSNDATLNTEPNTERNDNCDTVNESKFAWRSTDNNNNVNACRRFNDCSADATIWIWNHIAARRHHIGDDICARIDIDCRHQRERRIDVRTQSDRRDNHCARAIKRRCIDWWHCRRHCRVVVDHCNRHGNRLSRPSYETQCAAN